MLPAEDKVRLGLWRGQGLTLGFAASQLWKASSVPVLTRSPWKWKGRCAPSSLLCVSGDRHVSLPEGLVGSVFTNHQQIWFFKLWVCENAWSVISPARVSETRNVSAEVVGVHTPIQSLTCGSDCQTYCLCVNQSRAFIMLPLLIRAALSYGGNQNHFLPHVDPGSCW